MPQGYGIPELSTRAYNQCQHHQCAGTPIFEYHKLCKKRGDSDILIHYFPII
jgi:hypothetical protein